MVKFLLPFFLLFSLSACDYTANSLPNYISADYEVAFPIADTTITVNDIFGQYSPPSSDIAIRPGTVATISISYPFYLADLASESYIIHWIEPKAIIGNSFPEFVAVRLSCYISSLNSNQYTLADKIALPAGDNTLFTDKRINTSEFPIDQANRLHFIAELTITKATTLQELMQSELKIGFGLKVALQVNQAL